MTTAEDGAAALERIEADPSVWDLVISDLVMPRMGGDELYDTLQERGWSVPFRRRVGETLAAERRSA